MSTSVSHEDLVWWPYYLVDLGPDSTLSHRSASAWISIICLISGFVDMATFEATACCSRYPAGALIDSLRRLLLNVFQFANFLLLVATVVENPLLVKIYVWCALAFVLAGLSVSVPHFLMRVQFAGICTAMLGSTPQVAFLFVLFRCLPVVDKYRSSLMEDS